MIENIEKTAVARYLRELDHEKTLNNENESAKQRLRANAQKAVSDGTKNMVFTREQIGKMSGAEFAKNERMIMEQLRKGLIRQQFQIFEGTAYLSCSFSKVKKENL